MFCVRILHRVMALMNLWVVPLWYWCVFSKHWFSRALCCLFILRTAAAAGTWGCLAALGSCRWTCACKPVRRGKEQTGPCVRWGSLTGRPGCTAAGGGCLFQSKARFYTFHLVKVWSWRGWEAFLPSCPDGKEPRCRPRRGGSAPDRRCGSHWRRHAHSYRNKLQFPHTATRCLTKLRNPSGSPTRGLCSGSEQLTDCFNILDSHQL